MKLPNHEYAFIDIEKLRAYVLNPAHPEGRHKARVFLSALGISATDAAWLADEIRSQLLSCEAVPGVADEYGTRFQVDVALVRESRVAQVRTAWIIRNAEGFPRLVTCFVIQEQAMKIWDVVALHHDIPEKGLVLGQVGTAVEDLGEGVFEVEFADLDGRAYAFAALTSADVIVLHHEPLKAAA